MSKHRRKATRRSSHVGPSRRASGAFTLIELLVVIGIIALLIAIVTVVGGRVIAGSKATLTRDTIKAMDLIYAGYMADRDLRPDPGVPDPRNAQFILPVADARNMSAGNREIINSVGLFIHQMEREGQPVQATIAGLNSRLVTFYAADATSPPVPPSNMPDPNPRPELPQLRTVLDAWGRPMRYVHPSYSGSLYDATFDVAQRRGNYADPGDPSKPYDLRIVLTETPQSILPIQQIRRNAGEQSADPIGNDGPDSDGGICPKNGGVAYFYSAGPDGDPSTRDDNVYVEASHPTFPR